MTSGPRPRVFTIPPAASFLETLSTALLGGAVIPGFSRDAGPLGLASATIFVPTRRAARALAGTLAAAAGHDAVLLPRILPLGHLEATGTELLFDEPALPDTAATDLPDAIGDVARRMILMRMVLAWARAVRQAIVAVEPDGARTTLADEDLLVATSPADAWALAGDLAALNDELAIDGIEWSAIRGLGTEAFDRYWGITLDFLDIVVTQWPTILKERGVVDAVTRNIALVEAAIARLDEGRWDGPVLVVGSTGSNAVTARLMAAVARHSRGAVVLPGLDHHLDAASWAAIGTMRVGERFAATHPQALMKRLLGIVGMDRAEVAILGAPDPVRLARCRFVSDALRPAETTDAWRSAALSPLETVAALDGVTLIEAADEREEALALAIAMREALEGGGTAVLVTPDRALGRRVREELTRWSVEIDESGGEPLGTTPAGALARLVVDCALADLAPVELLALLAHPLARFGRSRAEMARLAQTLEIAILRGVLPPRALHDPEGLIARAKTMAQGRRAPDPLRRLRPADFDALAAFVGEVVEALAPLHRLRGEMALPQWIAAHSAVIEAIATDPDDRTVLTGIDGHALLTLFDTLAEAPESDITLDCAAYAALFDRWTAETPVRGPNRSHPRLKILGLLEARLLDADLILLGGLDETIWPPAAQTDAFLNRPMREALGLQPPERRIGQTAHDLEMAMGQPRVILSRARKRGGAPTVPSRFLQRMAALAGDAWGACAARGRRYVGWAEALDRPAQTRLLPRPDPKPSVDLRPTKLSVTRIETLRRDPYSIYAETILKLAPLEAIGAPMGPAQYGTSFHEILAGFARDTPPGTLSDGAMEDLLARAERAFADDLDEPSFRALYWPQVARWLGAFHSWDNERRAGRPTIVIEALGKLEIPLKDGSSFELIGYADRIETSASGLVTVVDYKTGAMPGLAEVQVGFSPQLTLEAAMIARGGFPTLGPITNVEGALYVKFGAGERVELRPLSFKDAAFLDVVERHYENLVGLLSLFRNPARGYPARPFARFASRFGVYDHLSRVKEWSATGGLVPGGEE